MSRLSILLLAVAAGASACAPAAGGVQAGTTPPATPDVAARPVPPLAAFASAAVVVVPAQSLAAGDSLGLAAAAGEPARYLSTLDDEIAFALAGRVRGWTMPADVVRTARRNPTFGLDAHALGAEELRADLKRGGPELSASLASRLRTLAAMHEARYVLVPVQLRFAGPSGAGRALLRVAMVDARTAQVRWAGDVAGDPSPSFSPALAASVAGHLADLISAAP